MILTILIFNINFCHTNFDLQAAHAIIKSYPNMPQVYLSNTEHDSIQKRLQIGYEIIKFGGLTVFKINTYIIS